MKCLKNLSVLVVCVLIAFSISSCKKEGCTNSKAANYDSKAKKDDGSCTCIAGLGGDITLVVTLQHHGNTISNTVGHLDTVFVEFSTQDNPGSDLSLYDTYFVGHAGEDHVHLEGLKCGQYYLYGAGFDTERITGGIPYELTDTTGEVHITVPVTEHH